MELDARMRRYIRLAGRSLARRRGVILAATALALPMNGCKDLLEVKDPEFADPTGLNTAAGVPILIATGLGDFQVGFGGDGNGNDSYLTTTALFTDEFNSSDTFTTRTAMDQRLLQPPANTNESDDPFQFLQLARRSLKVAADATERFFGADDPRLVRLRSLEGYTYIAFGEAYCSHVPFSETLENGEPGEYGVPLTTQQMFEAALTRFTTALGIDNESALAAVGRARALLNLGRFDEAATAVAAVPTEFVYKVEHSDNTTRQNNSVFALQDNGRFSVGEREGGGLPFRSARDPRIPWIGPFAGFDQTIPQFINLRYPSFDADVPLASGVEARLIEAEAALRGGNAATWLSKLNELRADVLDLMAIHVDDYERQREIAIAENGGGFDALAPLADPGTDAARVDLMFRERAFWLYNTGHRLGDLRRLARPVSAGGYGRSVATVFPNGAYFKGGDYGADVAFPLPQEEINNPNFDPNACNTTQP